MKKLAFLLIVNCSLLIVNCAFAQSSATMTIHLSGNNVITYNLSDIDSITFTPCTKSFSCGDSMVDSRDGQKYKTIQIGSQCWMQQNLNIGTRIDGFNDQTDNGIVEKYCYNDSLANCKKYGGLYQWNEMMNYDTTHQGGQGICPAGWHVPTDAEWNTLEVFLDPTVRTDSVPGNVNPEYWRGTDIATKMLKGGSSGFDALTAGFRLYTDGSFVFMGVRADFWTSSSWKLDNTYKWWNGFYVGHAAEYHAGSIGTDGSPVRCIEN